jgi:uncharacterized protein YjdB
MLVACLLVALPCVARKAVAEDLQEGCTVSILNRTAQVDKEGSWLVPNVPSGFGFVRARATCVIDGVTKSGQSDYFTITAGRMNAIVPIELGAVQPVPISVSLTAATTTLTEVGAFVSLTTTATYADGTSANVTSTTSGTNYTISNSQVANITANGLVTALSSGTVIVSATNEGALGMIQLRVVLSGDTDNDIH